MGFPGGAVVKSLPANAGDARVVGLIPGWGRSPGGRNGNWIQYSHQGNSPDRGACWTIVPEVTKSQMWLSTILIPSNRVKLGCLETSYKRINIISLYFSNNYKISDIIIAILHGRKSKHQIAEKVAQGCRTRVNQEWTQTARLFKPSLYS